VREKENAYRFWWGREHYEDLDIGKRIILKWMVRAGFIWFRIGTTGGLL
jgi:hypothetical protein